ncbi:Uncharacterised protein [Sphingobacterium daejeonense]|nr:Uncharacterised protein [Sphingobacterium daejeonense]
MRKLTENTMLDYISFMVKLKVDFNIIKNIKNQLRINNVDEVEIVNCISKIYHRVKNIEFSLI